MVGIIYTSHQLNYCVSWLLPLRAVPLDRLRFKISLVLAFSHTMAGKSDGSAQCHVLWYLRDFRVTDLYACRLSLVSWLSLFLFFGYT